MTKSKGPKIINESEIIISEPKTEIDKDKKKTQTDIFVAR